MSSSSLKHVLSFTRALICLRSTAGIDPKSPGNPSRSGNNLFRGIQARLRPLLIAIRIRVQSV
jgi:hypothetical protein